MENTLIPLIILLWAICWVLSTAILIACLQKICPNASKANQRKDLGFALVFGVTGPAALIAVLILYMYIQYKVKWGKDL